ncbi:uncharacterized protein LOC141607633 [Silene latifolia]|uniref:uncharacterized protein LOC141607633 n=1 Tax=Silene latifolia TaxID=37657 RepID=UPI003D773BF9
MPRALSTLGYARVMIEVAFVESIPYKVRFLDEHGSIVEIEVEFEWKPLVCSGCQGVGHTVKECRKAKKTPPLTSQPTKKKPVTQFWRPKNVDTPVIQDSKGKYSMGYNPDRPLMRLDRQEVTDGAYTVQKFGQVTFMEALNNSSTPKEGIGISDVLRILPSKDKLNGLCIRISIRVTEITTSNTFCVCMVYAFNDLNGRKGLWDQLALFAATIQEPWNLKHHFRRYNREHFTDIENSTGIALRNLKYFQQTIAENPESVFWIKKEQADVPEYKELLVGCTQFLSQKAKTAWIKDGDCNSMYFHEVIKSKFMKNWVLYIKNMDGDECDDPQSIQDVFLNYYQHLLGTEVKTVNVNPLIFRRGKVYTTDQWDLLLKPVTKTEIKATIFSILEHKAPGPDGFSSAFYKDSWSIIGDEVNNTILTLIPKCTMPTHVTQYRAISCCNVLYKCISKILCTRLAGVLLDLMTLNQGGFIKGRSNIENILVCQDLVRLYNRQACTPRCMFKMDVMKVYDSGDAASTMVLLRSYSSFSVASGLKINAQKSNAYFNGVGSRIKEEILSVSGFMEGQLPFKYLGVPITVGRLKKKDCVVLIDKIVERIRTLGAKKLSYADRLVLVNSVLSTLHTYWAAMFVLPKGVLDRFDSICRTFLWEGSTEYSKAPRVAWAKDCVLKKEGGLGPIHCVNCNAALIGKLVWCIVVKQDKLWVQWVHHVYLKGSPWLSYMPPPNTSWYWRKICKIKDLIQDGFADNSWSVRPAGYSV